MQGRPHRAQQRRILPSAVMGVAALLISLSAMVTEAADKPGGTGRILDELQGKWRSLDDPMAVLEFSGHAKAEHYGNRRGEFAATRVMEQCEDEVQSSGITGTYIVETGASMCWYLVRVSDRRLELSLVGGRGNTLRYTRLYDTLPRSVTIREAIDGRTEFDDVVGVESEGYLVPTGDSQDSPSLVLLSDSVASSFMATASLDETLTVLFADLGLQHQRNIVENCPHGCSVRIKGTGMTEWTNGPHFAISVEELHILAADPERDFVPENGIETLNGVLLKKTGHGWVTREGGQEIQVETMWFSRYRPGLFDGFLNSCKDACKADVKWFAGSLEGGVRYYQLVSAEVTAAN